VHALRPLAAAITVVVALVLAGPAHSGPSLDPYRGLGTWIDIYDPGAFADPEAMVAAAAARGVRTLYLETGNYRQRTALVRPDRLARFIEAAHAAGMQVVAWYLPAFRRVARDLERSLAAIEFRTPLGQGFDSFALDIEASVVRSPALRTSRMLELSRRLRAAVGEGYPLGAIIPSPRGMELSPSYWPGFPYPELAALYDVFLPMSYYTYRVEGPAAVRSYIERSIEIIRLATGDPAVPIHVIGGVGDRTSRREARAFMRAVAGCKPLGYSIYDFSVTREHTWAALAAIPAPPPDPAC
jgi:hypothetical protein